MIIHPTSIPGVMVVGTVPFSDHRGAFARLFCARMLADIIGARQIVQINHSRTNTQGAVRGMHFQHAPHAEMKLVRCLAGRVLDVAVDLRKSSPTFLSWHAEELSPDNANMLVVPEGCAHGFQVLDGPAELLYLHTAFYNKESEGGVRHDDPSLGITWPLPVTDISQRDLEHLLITKDFTGVSL
ncbi:MAG TPA: dTDP-4-dehydrorhamnose 3,5-epimerase [Rhodospirillaceae bacterium]|nr:MAG: dTDP-4-dehydrorhamnose 3,5-epimerase [Alphaproteobacteria bacterium GWF2_58_20]HAU28747.1 dTDP-4-dehydrorhamnose 3,5-epimerase [Rhodospirillaceae bacterium]